MKRVFLGGTQSGSKWRDELIPMLKINYTSPIATAHSKEISSEGLETGLADFILHVVSPQSDNFESLKIISTAVQNSNRRPERTILCVLFKDGEVKFNQTGKETLHGIMEMIQGNGSQVFETLGDLSSYLNSFFVDPEFDPNVLECLIERDGPTEVTLGRTNYKFEKNLAGDSVCEVWFREHRDYLLSLGDFRIYMKHKDKTEPEFTDEEWEFMREFKLLGADRFNAYVNSHIKQFNEYRDKVRAIVIEKWKALLPKMGCPLSLEPGKADEEPEFIDEWIKLDGVNFEKYVIENEEQFMECPGSILEKAKDKWDRLIFAKTGEPWPLVLETHD